MNGERIWALMLRHLYLLRGSWPRVIELAYWPLVQLLLWGFITQFFVTHSSWVAHAAGVLIAAVLLWDVLFRAQLGVSISFLEELWSRNLGHLFVAPLRPLEFVGGLMGMSLVRTLIGVGPAILLAIPLYHYNLFTLGLPLIAFFSLLLVFGWAIGIALTALILRYGLGAENFAWGAIYALAPISGIYYPVASLPAWVQPIALALPSTHVFEGMRAVLIDGTFRWDHFAAAAALNVLLFAAATALFLAAFERARMLGKLLQSGE